MRHLDLFAGIGGFSLAARWMGWETVAQVEWDKWCQKVLAKNFPDALRFGDIVEFNKMLQDGRITTDTEGAGLLREKELENNSENNGTGRGCNSSDLHKISKQDGEIITDTSSRKSWQSKTRNRREDISGRSEETYGKLSIGRINIITGGFPCQPFSHAGKRKGVADERYLWPEMLRTIRILKPSFVVGENVAGLVSMDNGKTLDAILADMENEGYQVESFIIPACAIGAWHRRDRIWIIAHSLNRADRTIGGPGGETEGVSCERGETGCAGMSCGTGGEVYANSNNQGLQGGTQTGNVRGGGAKRNKQFTRYGEFSGGDYWQSEPSVGRVANGIPNRVDRLKGLGNAIVPQVVFQIFKAIEQFNKQSHDNIR